MKPDEAAFETAICDWLVTHGGYDACTVGNAQGQPTPFDPVRGIDTAELFAFIGATQADEWAKIVGLHGDPDVAQAKFLDRLAAELDKRGTIDVLRRGVHEYPATIRLLYPRPASGLTPEVVANYEANRVTVTRQLPYQAGSTATLDLGLFVNGLLVATAELKNPLTGQDVSHAKAQYRKDRDPANRALSKRAVVHFAVDPELVFMTTRLAGDATRFLPFNVGRDNGAGNPANPHGHRTAYLWERVWQRDAWLDLLARFVHVEKDSLGAKVPGRVIFPRFHQWDAVLALEAAAKDEGAGHPYLVQHSAGSGKSNTIAWLAHRLSNLHDHDDRKVFDKVVVITDRVVLDRQLQETIGSFEHSQGVVERIDSGSRQLAEALAGEQARIVITTLQKFGFVLDKVADLPERTYAVIVDEAHSSQTGEAAKELRRVLGAPDAADDHAASDNAAADDAELGPATIDDALAEAVAARGRQPNLSYFAFTATPKGKTLELFGRFDQSSQKHQPFHLYSMRQAIEERFIEDVLASYTTYETYFRLEKAIADDPRYDTQAARAAIARFVTLHESNLDQKAAVVVDHFVAHVAGKVGGRAKAMVVCSSRHHAVRFCRALRAYADGHGHGLGVLVAFSGTVDDAGAPFTEASMNGFADTETAKRFDTDAHRIMVVAEKFQTGFDQPLLHTMYVDKPLSGLAAVQTLSRLNRTHPDKDGTFVLDFRNDAESIRSAFEPYHGLTVAPPTDPNLLHDTRQALDEFGILRTDETTKVVGLLLDVSGSADHGRIHAALAPAIDRVAALDDDERGRFRDALTRFVRTYGFLAQIVPLVRTDLERDYLFCRALSAFVHDDAEGGGVDLGADLEITHLRLQKQFEGSVSLGRDTGEVTTIFSGTGPQHEPEPESLSTIIERFNERYGTDWTDADRLFPDAIAEDLVNDATVQLEAGANGLEAFKVGFDQRYQSAVAARLDRNEKVAMQLLDDDAVRAALTAEYLPLIYARARVAHQRTCPIGELVGADREDLHLEYKSTLRWDIRAESKKTGIPAKAALKTIAGFLNSPAGGTLLIGVADDGAIFGLEADYATFGDRGKKGDRDLWGQHLDSLLHARVGAAAATLVTWEFHSIGGADVCRVSVEPADFPVEEGVDADEAIFWWRYNTGTRAVTDPRERERIIRRRFGIGGGPA